MNRLIFIGLLLSVLLVNKCHGTILFSDSFDGYADKAAVSAIWGVVGSQVELISPGYGGNGKAMQWVYNSGGLSPYEFGKYVDSYNLSDIYIRAYVRFSTINPLGGCKGIKLFGGGYNANGQYANTTFNFGPVSGGLYLTPICNGDGSSLQNDTQICYDLSGWHEAGANGYTFNTVTSNFIPDMDWHSVEVNLLYNTNGQSNGRTRVWIDGVLRIDVTGIRNRNDANLRYVERVAFGDYGNASANFTMEIDNITIADSYIGVLDGDTTAPTITAFVIPSTSISLIVPISTFTATDAVGVTGYCVTETNDSGTCSWVGSAPASHTFSTEGSKTLYAFARDAALNVSTVASDGVVITLPVANVTGISLAGSVQMMNN